MKNQTPNIKSNQGGTPLSNNGQQPTARPPKPSNPTK